MRKDYLTRKNVGKNKYDLFYNFLLFLFNTNSREILGFND